MTTKKTSFYLAAVSALLISSASFSTALATPLRSGFYVGAGASATWLGIKSSRYVTSHNISMSPMPTKHFSGSSKTYLSPYVKLGYQKIFDNKFYLAAELSAEFGQSKLNVGNDVEWPKKVADFQVEAKLRQSYALSALLGREITPSTAAYLRLGVVHSNAYYDFEKIGATYFKEGSQKKGLWGGRIGVGVVHQLSKHVMLGVDYAYTFYGSSKYSSRLPAFSGDRYITSHKSYRLHSQQVMVSLSYVF